MRIYKIGTILGIVTILFSSWISQLFLSGIYLMFEMFGVYITEWVVINANISIVVLGILMVWYNVTEIRRYGT